jgi:hypothetical protein
MYGNGRMENTFEIKMGIQFSNFKMFVKEFCNIAIEV